MATVIAKSVRERWEEFAREALKDAVGGDAELRAELCRFFYAGYVAALETVQELRDGAVAGDDAAKVLDGHAQECCVLLHGLSEEAARGK